MTVRCVLCGTEGGHDRLCDRNPDNGQPIEYQLARVACAIPVPKGFGQCVDGTDGERVGTNVASVEEWRQFFVAFLAQGVLQSAEQSLCAECGKGEGHINHRGGYVPWGNDPTVNPHDFRARTEQANGPTSDPILRARAIEIGSEYNELLKPSQRGFVYDAILFALEKEQERAQQPKASDTQGRCAYPGCGQPDVTPDNRHRTQPWMPHVFIPAQPQ